MEYALYCSLAALIAYGIWFFKNLVAAQRAKQVQHQYETSLDGKLLPLQFKKTRALIGGREHIINYKRNALQVTLRREVSFDTNYMDVTNGKQTTSFRLDRSNATTETLRNILEEWLVKNP